MTTLTMRNTGGTDHQSFDAAGIPAFQFIQDPLDYETRTHHSNMDVYDRLQPDDFEQAAVIVASFVYEASMRDQMLPRKPLEKALPQEVEKPDEQIRGCRTADLSVTIGFLESRPNLLATGFGDVNGLEY